MNLITFPLKPQMHGPKVRDLHTALLLLLDRDNILQIDGTNRRDLFAALKPEQTSQTYGEATNKLVSIFQNSHHLEASGTVDEPTANALNSLVADLAGSGGRPSRFAVKGTVHLSDGSPLVGIKVSAFDRDLRTEQLLGQSQTDRKGSYQIEYDSSQFQMQEKASADLVVKAIAPDGSILAVSSVLFNAPSTAVVDLTLSAETRQPPTLFEKIETALKPLLAGLKVEELEEDKKNQDLTFLSGETGIGTTDLARFALAARLAGQAVQPEFWFVLLGGTGYELFENQSLKEQLKDLLDGLSSLDAASVRKAFNRGFNLKEIPAVFRDKVEGWIETFLKFTATQTFSPSENPTFVKSALEDAGIKDAKKLETFALLFNQYKALTPELLDALAKDSAFKKEEIADLRTSFQLAEMTGADFSVIKIIKEEFKVREPDKIRSLAKKSQSEWVNLVKENYSSGRMKLPVQVSDLAGQGKLPEAEVYGRTLERQFREAFPTTAFAGGLGRALQNGGSHGLRHAETLASFLDSHDQFEFLDTPLDAFLTSVHSDSGDLADEGFKFELKAVQRVFKLAPTFEAVDALLADDLHSAQRIYRTGQSEFVRQYGGRSGFTPESARVAWNRAADTHAAVLTIVADLKSLEAEALPAALQNNNATLATFPNWNNLFQTGDLCECEHCRSVLSPAAYFADLLVFLKDRKAANPAQTVKDILFHRRPDLGFLELNCENALTPLPYVDVVCEVLEDVIAAGDNDIELTGLSSIPTDPIVAKAAVLNAFAAQQISLGADFSLTQINPADPDRWVAHGDEVTYLLKKKGGPIFFAEILRNTKADAAELRAYPQYVNPKAYEKLRAAKYPLALPFDLFGEEVRAAFQKSNLQRWDLMRTLRGTIAPNNPNDGDIACEYFNISADPASTFDERRLILVADATVAGQQAVWGEPGNVAWLDAVSNVKTFLQKTDLEYNELLALLDLKFVNPTGDIVIHHLDASCDTNQKLIQTLDETKLDRIHRFLRLWRKVSGWKIWELDLAIRHPRIGNGVLDESFLINLFYFTEVQKGLGAKTTVEQALALFGNLNTESHFTELHARRTDALYQQQFLNKKLIHPLDRAFQLDSATNDLPAGQTISGHSAVMAVLGIGEADLNLLKQLTRPSDGLSYITDDLNLSNLSFLRRHAWLAKVLKYKVNDWIILLKILNSNLFDWASPKSAFDFLETIRQIKASGFTPDQLNWLLAADRTAKASVKEDTAGRFLLNLRTVLQTIRSEFDPLKYDFLQVVPPVNDEQLELLLGTLLQKLGRDEAGVGSFLSVLREDVVLETTAQGLPAGFAFPAALSGIPINYDEPNQTLRFRGLMTSANRTTLLSDPLLAMVTGIPAYQAAIEDLFQRPRLEVKFYQPVFSAPLDVLPSVVDFKVQLPADLAAKIVYNTEERLLQFTGVMLPKEQVLLDALVPNALPPEIAYHNAIGDLVSQPTSITLPDDRIWLTDADLDLTLPANDTNAKRMANAAGKALAFLSKTQAENAVVQQSSDALGLTEPITREILTRFKIIPPDNILAFFTGGFSTSSAAISYAAFQNAFDTWFWLNRVAQIVKKWKINLEELEQLLDLQASAHLLDFETLPLNDSAPLPALDDFLRTGRLLRLRDSLPEAEITLLEVLEHLQNGEYATPADFAADVALLNEEWIATDVEAIVAALDLSYPAGYLLVESWERLRRAFYFRDSLNAGADIVKTFAASAMTEAHAKTIKELLRSSFGEETWLTLSAEIQDALRERKRDSLAAYLLAQPMPADAPSGKWENTNDLYAYYLLDVEMCSCQLTSRLVQGSGSIQLFVQRCLMGLENEVKVKAGGDDGDSAWLWWKWMRKYRVWEANRKVFLWPENWIEPELKQDRSQFFKDLENDLLQNEINPENVETAFTSYLEKLESVKQLEIAGFFQEDDGDRAVIHVFGRTIGAEPHLYYYRRYDYRQWTPWQKVDLDIQGDYLVPAVVNKRLFLCWPVFTEEPDEEGNSTVPTPKAEQSSVPVQKAKKTLKLQLAVSDYRQGKWAPKRVSKDFAQSFGYDVQIIKRQYTFFPIDRTEVDGRFGIKFSGWSVDRNGYVVAGLFGTFEISGCKGVPELTSLPGYFKHAVRPESAAVGGDTLFLKWTELPYPPYPARTDAPQNDFTLENSFVSAEALRFTTVLMETPWIFRMTPPWQLSYLDKLWLNGLVGLGLDNNDAFKTPVGTWLPFFYNDKKRTFFVLPAFVHVQARNPRNEGSEGVIEYYPDIKRAVLESERYFEGLVRTWVDGLPLSTLTPADRQKLDQLLWQSFPEEAPPPLPGNTPPPYTEEELKLVRTLIVRYVMRFYHFYLGAAAVLQFQSRQFHFKNFYHPFVCDFARLVYNPLKGIPALMTRETQMTNSGFSFRQSYQPTASVVEPQTEKYYPKELVDFSPDGSYSSYNWELFFHAPLLIANQLSKDQRFEEARDWYHFIFNPIGVESSVPGGSAMSKFWITKPFFDTTDPQYVQQRIDNILRMLAGDASLPGYSAQAKKDLEDQVLDWRTNPFDPHRIANYRTVAYQKTVVMKYLDNLISWGDFLFRQDSMESINEATQLYVMAAEILGPRPKTIPPQAQPPLETFNELENSFDRFSNALVEVENLIPVMPGDGGDGADQAPLPMLYFCIPQNDKLLGYWDTVADRLYKIRHCMNIEGVVRQLALFEPPIDPGALVKAVAAGVDIGAALADLNAPLPIYRFNVVLQKANEVCNDVKALGSALLSALEKRDAEALGLLRQGQEIRLLEAIKVVRETQIQEAKELSDAVKKNLELAQIKKTYYESRQFMDAEEIVAAGLNFLSLATYSAGTIADVLAGVMFLIPDFRIGGSGFGGSPHFTAEPPTGTKAGNSASRGANGLYHVANALSQSASWTATMAGFVRRQEEWDFQKDIASKEMEQIEKSIAAAELRVAIAEKELENHALQIENAKATDTFMRSKYTNGELFQWQVGQISGVYFQSYQLAYDLAKRAERCFRFELGLQDSSFINFGYWDSLKKGLLSGEKLQYDLRRLEAAYLDQNRREFELTRHISLLLLDPLALVKLRETGRCFLRLPEEIFDLDFPGHYFRRIKSVSLTLPCVVGPYTTISCTLRLLKNSIRINSNDGSNADNYPRHTDDQGLPADDDRFIENNIPVKAIAASTSQNDSGMFELNFRDERYLPFEGSGALSEWSLELFNDLPSNNADFGKPLRQFDYRSISDVILHLKYTAREDAGTFKNGAIAHLRNYFSQDGSANSLRSFNLRQEFPTQWSRFLNPGNPANGNIFELEMSPNLFSFRDSDKTLKINFLWLFARCSDAGVYKIVMTPPLHEPPPTESNVLSLPAVNQYAGLHFVQKDTTELGIEVVPTDAPVKWRLRMNRPGGGNLQEDPLTKVSEVEDIVLVLGYGWE